MSRILVVAVCCLFAAASKAAGQVDLPVINGAMSGDGVINGHAEAGSAPIIIYDLSYPVRTALGSGTSMDNDGNFAVLVSPALIEGHEIVAIDKAGHSSQPVVVIAPDPLTGLAE